MSKIVKKMELDALQATLGGVRDMILLSPNRIDSGMEYAMRKTLRDKKVHVKMVKNTLARKVLADGGVNLKAEHFAGTTLIAWGPESVKDLSKAVDGFIKDIVKKNPKNAEKLTVKTAVADGQEVSMEAALKMPTRLEAIGEIISAILAPASAIAGCLIAPGGELASQIKTLADRKEEEPAAPAAA